jgi:hypothetical protein
VPCGHGRADDRRKSWLAGTTGDGYCIQHRRARTQDPPRRRRPRSDLPLLPFPPSPDVPRPGGSGRGASGLRDGGRASSPRTFPTRALAVPPTMRDGPRTCCRSPLLADPDVAVRPLARGKGAR